MEVQYALARSGAVVVRPLLEADLEAADRVMRLAFCTFLGLPDPLQFMGDADFVHTRWRADPSAGFCVEVEGVVVGSVFVGNWGSVGFFGPLTVHPDYWGQGVAQLLLKEVMACFERWGTRHMGLYTFPTSVKHIGLYRKFGFWPGFLTMVMEKEVRAGDAEVSWTKFSDVPVAEREGMLGRCRVLTGNVYEGLDVGVEIRSVAGQLLGETVLLWHSDELVGLAVCHCGAGTEAGGGIGYIKFAAVNARGAGDVAFRRLLMACEALAAERGLQKLSRGMNTARQEAWATMLDSGWRGKMVGVAMERPNEPGYNRPGVFVIDDWR
jgi:GNAT superfamily N-acetyltransferase